MPNKKIIRLLLAVLLLVFCLFFNTAAEDSEIMLPWQGFSAHSLLSPNATLSVNERGFLEMDFKRVTPTVSAKIDSYFANASHNAIRLCITNDSACNSLLFTYRYVDRIGETQSVSEKVALASRGVRNDYYIYTDVADRITDISMTFSDVSTGKITIASIDFVSIYNDTADVCGTMTACIYDQEQNTVKISGNINYEIVTEHRKAKLVLYAVDMDATSLPYGSPPLASVPMSSHFDFSLSKLSIEERMKAYVVAVVSESGEQLYAFAPRVPTSETKDLEETRFFKGVHTDYGISAARANVGMAVVDVDFAKLTSSGAGEGILYAFEGRYFYFNRQYLTVLDSEIQKSYENGMRIVLRFFSSAPSTSELPSILADSEESRIRLYAYTEFLCSRYSGNSRGVASAILFGHAADQVSLKKISMAQYTQLYVNSLFVISEAAIAEGREVSLLVPISDCFETSVTENVSFSPRLFLTSLGKILQKRYDGKLQVHALVESDAMSGEGSSMGQLGFEYLREFSNFLRRIHDTYPAISEQYLYYWEPDQTEHKDLLKASLLHGYYMAVCERNAYGFIFSTTHISDVSLGAELMSVLQFADSAFGKENAEQALTVLGEDEWQDLIVGYSEKKIQTVEYHRTEDASVTPYRFLGETYLWDFSSMGNDYGWSPGDGCSSIVMEKNEETNRALAASMLPQEKNNYESELIYYFDEAKNFSVVDTVSFAIRINAPEGKYQVTVQICGEDVIEEAQLSVSAQKLTTIYVNTSDLFAEQEVRCIRIFVTPITENLHEYTLLLGSISAHSATQNSETLEQMLRTVQRVDDVYRDTSHKIEPIWIYVIAFLAFVSIMVIVALYFRSDDEET